MASQGKKSRPDKHGRQGKTTGVTNYLKKEALISNIDGNDAKGAM